MTEVKVQVTNLVKNFGTNQVLKDINVTVQANEVVVIIGPSGSCKSTFFANFKSLRNTNFRFDCYRWGGYCRTAC